jgi:endoglucanase
MNESEKKFLFDLLDTPSPTGFESAGQRKWMDYMRRCADSVESDAYGTAWATRAAAAPGDGAPTVFLEAHADEIGFIVNFITENGFLQVTRIGGSDRAIARGKRVRILGDKGDVAGVIGNIAIHLRDKKDEKVPEWHQLFVDIGASTKQEVEERGVRVGHPMVYAEGVEELRPGRLIGRALDNRIGGYILSQVMARLAQTGRLPATVYAVNAVQEEIGGHGARMIAYRLHPTVAIILDVTHATDSPGVETSKHGDVRLGAGPSVTHGSFNHPEVVRRLLDVAREEEIPIQHEAASVFTGTDLDDVFIARTGVPSALVSLPMRYMHSTIESVDLEDVEKCIRLLAAFARSVGREDTFRLPL